MDQKKTTFKIQFFFVSFIILILLSQSYSKTIKNSNYLKIPFKTKLISLPKDENQTYNESSFLSDFFENNFILDMSLGSPPQNVTVLLETTNGEFSFNQGQKHLNYLLNSINNKNYFSPKPYNIEKSTTSKKISETSSYYYMAEDIFYLNSTLNTKIQFSYNVYLSNTTDVYGTLGINLDMFNSYSNSKFIEQLKTNGIINKYLLSFVYKSKYNIFNDNPGFLYIGPEPHHYDSENYKYYQYIKTYFNCVNKTDETKLLDWEIKFDAVQYAIKKNAEYGGSKYIITEMLNKTVVLDINSNLIIGTKEYYDLIDGLFFKEYLRFGLCFKKIAEYNSKNYYVYYCDRDLLYSTINYADMMPYSVSFAKIPEIHFKNVNLQYTFLLEYSDMFYEIGKNYYFKIIFEVDKNNTIWNIGKFLLEKYQIIFDINSKTFGIYNPDLKYREPEEEEEEPEEPEPGKIDENDKKIGAAVLKYVIIVVVILVVIGLSVFIGMKIKEPRKKRANELLDDNFDYEGTNEKNNNSNDGIKEELTVNAKNAIINEQE